MFLYRSFLHIFCNEYFFNLNWYLTASFYHQNSFIIGFNDSNIYDKFERVFEEVLELNQNLGLKSPCLSFPFSWINWSRRLVLLFFDRFRCYFLIIKLSFITMFNAASIASHKFFAVSRTETCTFFVDHFSFHGARYGMCFQKHGTCRYSRFLNLNRDFWNLIEIFQLKSRF